MNQTITITIPDEVAKAALEALTALPIRHIAVYQSFLQAVQVAEQEREQAARAAVIAEHEQSKEEVTP